MDDLQFISSPGLADVDGDGSAEILQGSGAYLLRAYRSDGTTPDGWPKFTHGWLLGSPTAGDVDGDGRIEVTAVTREGRLYIWDTTAPAVDGAVPWQGFGRDRRNTQNLVSGVPTTVGGYHPFLTLLWELEGIVIELDRLDGPGSTELQRLVRHVIAWIEDGDVGSATSLFPRIERGLREVESSESDVHGRFVSAVRETGRIMVQSVDCAAGETPCEENSRRAQGLVLWGDFFNRLGWSGYAVYCWGQSIHLVHRWVHFS
jgi:hypothetical protein